MTSIQTAVFYLFRTAASPTRSEQTSHSYPDTHSSTCGAHGTRCIFSPIAFRLSGTRSLDRSISIPFFFSSATVHLTLRVSPARRLRSLPIARRRRGGWDPYPSSTELAVAGDDGGRRSSARICPRTRPGLAPRSVAARWATTASLCGRAHQEVAATPAEAGTTGARRPRESDPGSGGSW